MTRFWGLFLMFSLTASSVLLAGQLDLTIEAESAILMNANSGAILFEKNSHILRYPASITKVATALYALSKTEHLFEEDIVADQECIGTVKEEVLRRSNYTLPAYLLIPDGSHIGIKRGEILKLKDLMYGMMVASGDDAANVIAKYVSGTIPQFMEELNQYIRKLGCVSTTLHNPHGLHHPKHQTTAYEMALIAREALKNPTFRQLVSAPSYTRPKTNKQEACPLVQSNKLIRQGPYYYSKAIGVKTGYYSLAGNTFIGAAEDGERTLIAVLLKVKHRKDIFLDAKKMFEAAFQQMKVKRTLLHKGIQKFALKLPDTRTKIRSYLKEDVSITYYPAEEQEVRCMLQWNKNLKLPIAKDQQIGELVFVGEGQHLLMKVPLYALKAFKLTFFEKIFQLIGKNSALLKIGALIAFTLLIATVLFWRRRSRPLV